MHSYTWLDISLGVGQTSHDRHGCIATLPDTNCTVSQQRRNAGALRPPWFHFTTMADHVAADTQRR